MNAQTQQKVREILAENVRGDEESVLREIVKVVDADMSDVLTRTMEFGELLEAVGLHIVAKE